MIPTAEQGNYRSRSWAARACDPGAGKGRAGNPVLGVFLLAVGLGLAAPGCGAALPSPGADPVPDSGGEEPPIFALIWAVIRV